MNYKDISIKKYIQNNNLALISDFRFEFYFYEYSYKKENTK